MAPRRATRRGATRDGGFSFTSSSSVPSAMGRRVAEGVSGLPARKRAASAKRPKRAKCASAPCTRKPGGTLTLSDVGERAVLSFLPYLPDRIKAESVCKRWKRLSQLELPIHELDFSTMSMKKVSRVHLKAMLARVNGNLTRVVLPGFSLDDASLVALKLHTGLLHMRAYSLSNKQIFDLLSACTELRTLELLDCQFLNFVRWEPRPARLRSIRFNACHMIKTPAIASLIAHSGDQLRRLELTGAVYVESSIFRVLAQHSSALEELSISYVRATHIDDLQSLVQARYQSLRLLDLTSCSGFDFFPDSTVLIALEVLVLDNTAISDEGVRAVSRVATSLKYLSLQNCHNLSDQGMVEFSAPDRMCGGLKLLDLKGTRMTDVGVEALEIAFPHLDMLRLDSCRNVSRFIRLRHGESTRKFLQRRATTASERLAISRIATPEQQAAAAAILTSESDGGDDSDASYRG